MTISERLLPEFRHEMANTRKILERLPEDKLTWRPHERSMTLGRLAGHVAEMASWANHALATDELDLAPDEKGSYEAHIVTSVPDTLNKFDGWVAEAEAALAKTPDEAYERIWKLTSKGQTFLEMPRGAVVRSVVMNHLIHHRGQLTVYLRLVGVAVPGFYGPSNDEIQPAS